MAEQAPISLWSTGDPSVSEGRPATYVRFVKKSHHWRDALRQHGAASGMKMPALAVVMMLEIHADADGSNAHPGEKILAERLGTSLSTVTRGMALARKLGWVFCTQAGNHRVNNASVWRVCIPSYVPVSEGEAKAGVLENRHVSTSKQSKRGKHDGPRTIDGRVVDTRSIAEQKRDHERMLRDEGYQGD
jgi:hypothetical protein